MCNLIYLKKKQHKNADVESVVQYMSKNKQLVHPRNQNECAMIPRRVF